MNKKIITLAFAAIMLFPTATNAQLVSFQPGTGREKPKKETKKENGESFIEPFKADDSNLEASVKADIVSHYIWRGQDLAGLSIQPSASVSWKGLSLTAEGSTGILKDDYHEVDLTLGYKFGPLNIGVSDYWCTGIDSENRYLYYDKHKGAHKYEANLGFTCKYFSLQGYCMFWGNDFKIDPNGRAYTEDRAYSTYIELGIPFRLGGLDFEAKAGITPMESGGTWETQQRETLLGLKDVDVRVYEYAEGFACCSASLRCTKDISLGKLSMPVFAEFNANPYMSTAHMIFGLSIKPW